jgi:hypothetical protein
VQVLVGFEINLYLIIYSPNKGNSLLIMISRKSALCPNLYNISFEHSL